MGVFEPAILAYMIPATGAENIYRNANPAAKEIVDNQQTWPLIDFCTVAKYDWQREATQGDQPDGLGVTFDDPILLDDDTAERLLLYTKTGGGLFWSIYMATTESPSVWHSYDNDEGLNVGGVDYDSEKILPGAFVTIPNAFSISAVRDQHLKGVYLSRPGDEGEAQAVTVSELAIFKSVDLPYNPELTTYTITPQIPPGASQTFESLAGRRQVLVYSDLQYKITMSYTWSDQAATKRLMTAIERTLQQGSPLLFCEPYQRTDEQPLVTDRRCWLLMLDDVPTISMIAPDTWTVTITGTSQP